MNDKTVADQLLELRMKISAHLSVSTSPSLNLLTTETMETKLESFFYHVLNRSCVRVRLADQTIAEINP